MPRLCQNLRKILLKGLGGKVHFGIKKRQWWYNPKKNNSKCTKFTTKILKQVIMNPISSSVCSST